MATQMTANDYFERGKKQAEKGNYEEALTDFNEAIRQDPQMADAFIRRAMIHKRLGHAEEGRDDIQVAQQLFNSKRNKLIATGDLRFEQQDYKGAIAAYEDARSSWVMVSFPPEPDDDYYRASMQLARAYVHLGKFENAVEEFQDIAGSLENVFYQLPEYSKAYVEWGNKLSRSKKRSNEAILAYSEALLGNPHNTEALYKRGRLLLEAGYPISAIEDFQQLLNSDPANPNASEVKTLIARYSHQADESTPNSLDKLLKRFLQLPIDLGKPPLAKDRIDFLNDLCDYYLISASETERLQIRNLFGHRPVIWEYIRFATKSIKTAADGKWLRRVVAIVSIEDMREDYRDAMHALQRLERVAKFVKIDPKPNFAEVAKISNSKKNEGAADSSMKKLLERWWDDRE